MQNPIVEAELQDICAFRQNILSSFHKINQQISQIPTALTLTSHCNCIDQTFPIDPLAISFFQDKPAPYSSQKIDFWAQRKSHNHLHQKNDRINKYLNEYDLNSFNFDLEPFRESKNHNKDQNHFHIEIPFKNNLLSDKLNKSADQVTNLPLYDQKLTVAKIKRPSSSNSNFTKATKNEVKSERKQDGKGKSQIKWKNEQKENILTARPIFTARPKQNQSVKSVKRHQSFCESSKKKPLKSKNPSSRGFLSHRQAPVEKVVKLSPQEEMREQVCRRIKKRISLSWAVYKSSRQSFDAIYQKELRERQEILSKMVNHPKVVKKFGSVIMELK